MRWTVIPLAAALAAGAAERADLDGLLARLAENAAHYRSQALRLTCDETIRWAGDAGAGQGRFGYVYVFDDDEGFEEYRTRRRAQAKPGARRVEPSELGIPVWFNNAYLWCFTFRADRQARHEYTLLGSEQVAGVEAAVIRFEPLAPLVRHVNDWYGTAWVDPRSAQLLKVEAYTPQDWAKLQALRAGVKIAGTRLDVRRITTWFEQRLEQLNVPSRVELRDETYVLQEPDDWLSGEGWDYRVLTPFRVDQTYDDYRLFGVRATPGAGPADPAR